MLLPLVLFHTALMEGEGYVEPILILVLFVVVKCVEWIFVRQKKKPVVEKNT